MASSVYTVSFWPQGAKPAAAASAASDAHSSLMNCCVLLSGKEPEQPRSSSSQTTTTAERYRDPLVNNPEVCVAATVLSAKFCGKSFCSVKPS